MQFKRLLVLNAFLFVSLYGQDTIKVDMTINQGYKQQPSIGLISIPNEELKQPVQLFAPDSVLLEVVQSEIHKDQLRILIDKNGDKTLADEKPIHLRKDSVVVVTVKRGGHFQPPLMLKYQLSYRLAENGEGSAVVSFHWRSHYRAEGTIRLNNEEFLIAILDSDGNGIFNRRDFKGMTNIQFDANSDGTIWGQNEYFWGDQILPFSENNLLLKEISQDGSYVIFEKTELVLPTLKAKIPEFKVPTTDGKFLSNTSLLGENYVLVFWASWCVPCVESLPELVTFAEKYTDNIKFLSINVDSEKGVEKARRIISDYKINWPQVMTGEGRENKLWKLFRSETKGGIPLYALVDSEGLLQYYGRGGKELNDLKLAILATQTTK